MAYRIVLRQDTAANWTKYNPLLLNGEFGFEEDTDKLKLGDGVHKWRADGPTPQGGAPDRPQRMGPAGPSALAAGVAGRFDRPSESTWAPTGESGRSLVTALSIPVGGALNALRRRKKVESPMDKVMRFTEENRPDRSLYGSGQSLMDINLKYGLPTSGLKALEGRDPTMEMPAPDVYAGKSTGRMDTRVRPQPGLPSETVSGPFAMAQPRALPAGKPQSNYAVSGTDETAARVSQVGGTYTDVGMRPSAKAEAVQETARLQEFPAAKPKSRNKNRGKKK